MIQNEVLALNFIAFIVMPVIVETTICLNPSPEHRGEVCDWQEKKWIRNFDIETKRYYYTLEEQDLTDNFFERKMRKRYLEKGKKYYGVPESHFRKNAPTKKYVEERKSK